MTGWEDWGYDPWGQHRWVKPVGHIRYVVSSGSLGLYAGIHYRGVVRFPLGEAACHTVETARAFLDQISDALAGMCVSDRDAAIMKCGLTRILPVVIT